MIPHIVFIRNATLIFQSEADISFVGWIRTLAYWRHSSCTAVWKGNLDFCSRARKGALVSWMWHSYNCVGTKLAVNQSLCLSACPPGRLFVLHWLKETGGAFKRQAEEKIERHLKHISTLLPKWKPSNFEWIDLTPLLSSWPLFSKVWPGFAESLVQGRRNRGSDSRSFSSLAFQPWEEPDKVASEISSKLREA